MATKLQEFQLPDDGLIANLIAFNVGVELEVIPNRLEIFVNLAQSSVVTEYQEQSYIGIDNLLERITFVLDLNNLRLDKL